MASDFTAEVDLSGTTVIGYSLVADMAGGPFFRLNDGQLSSVHVKDAFTNYDGLGRKLRVRYDTPSFSGFSLATSVGTQVVPTETDVTVWDVAARYDQTYDEFKVSLRRCIFRTCRGPEPVRWLRFRSARPFRHQPDRRRRLLRYSVTHGRYGYIKLGYQTDYFEAGKTAVSIDAFTGQDIDALGSDSTSFGLQLVEHVDYLQTELYLGVRSYSNDEPGVSIDDSTAVLA